MKKKLQEWVEQQLEFIGHDILGIEAPYSIQELERMKIPCSKIGTLYDLIDAFDLDINWTILKKYKEYANIRF